MSGRVDNVSDIRWTHNSKFVEDEDENFESSRQHKILRM